MSDYSKEISESIRRILEELNLEYSFFPNEGKYKMMFINNDDTIKRLQYIIKIYESDYNLYIVFPIGVKPDDREKMIKILEFISRANHHLLDGDFEINMKNGVIRYKVYVDCASGVPDDEVIKNSIYCPAAMCKIYGSGIADIIFNNKDPLDALEECEREDQDSIHTEEIKNTDNKAV